MNVMFFQPLQVNMLLDNIFEQREKNGRYRFMHLLTMKRFSNEEPPFEALISRDWGVAAGPQSPQLPVGLSLSLQGWLGGGAAEGAPGAVMSRRQSALLSVVLIAHLNSALEFETAGIHLM